MGIAYLCIMNIKQEFGKWFLDVAKYVLTPCFYHL